MATFLWALQCSGITIALLGLGRERWLKRSRLPFDRLTPARRRA